MKGIINNIKVKKLKTKKDNKEFKLIEISVDVKINDKNEFRTYRADWSENFAKNYLKQLGLKINELIGRECEVQLSKREYYKEDVRKIVTFIKYLTLLDENGELLKYIPEDIEDFDF